MCDENIAVSIRTLNQMSSIIPNRMEKLKLASLSAGIVAGFTTDCSYGDDLSLMRGYDTLVAPRVESLSHVLRSYIVLNKTWYNTGAQSISNIRNIFITGRKHPVNTIKNAFAIISKVESNQNNIEGDMTLFHGLYILNQYGIDLDAPFYRLLESTREKGLLHTVKAFREHVIKTAKRITKDGTRLDILDDSKLEVITSVMTGLIMGYCEPLPTTTVDFNQYYATAAYPYGLSLLNELVEKLTVNTDLIFNTYRSTLETRYELSYEPVATVRGVLALLMDNNILAEDMSKSIDISNKEELLDYIVGMVKGVYDVRKSAAEREVLHDLDFLPVNPIHELVNVPESPEELSKRMEEMVASNESALIELNALLDTISNQRIRTVSNEALTGSQKLGILFMVVGGALMAWAVYATFFKNAASHTKSVEKLRDQINKDLAETNKVLSNLKPLSTPDLKAQSARMETKLKQLNATGNTSELAKQILQGKNPIDAKVTNLSYPHKGENIATFYDFSKFKASAAFETYSHFMEAMNTGLLENMFDKRFDDVKTLDELKARCAVVEKDCKDIVAKYGVKFPAEFKGSNVNVTQLTDYMRTNVNDNNFIRSLEKAEKQCMAAYTGIDSMKPDESLALLDAELTKHGVDEATRKQMGVEVKKTINVITETFKQIAKTYLLLVSNVRIWENLVFKHLGLFRFLMHSLTTEEQIENPAVKRVHL